MYRAFSNSVLCINHTVCVRACVKYGTCSCERFWAHSYKRRFSKAFSTKKNQWAPFLPCGQLIQRPWGE